MLNLNQIKLWLECQRFLSATFEWQKERREILSITSCNYWSFKIQYQVIFFSLNTTQPFFEFFSNRQATKIQLFVCFILSVDCTRSQMQQTLNQNSFTWIGNKRSFWWDEEIATMGRRRRGSCDDLCVMQSSKVVSRRSKGFDLWNDD